MIAIWLGAAYLALLTTKAVLAWRYARALPEPSETGFEGVCVAQAVLSGDPGLGTILEDNVRALEGPRFLWLVDTDDPDGLAICAGIRNRYPGRRIDVITFSPPPAGVNPKLHKLEAARASVHEPVLVVLDDDTRLPAPSLAALLQALRDHDLATGLPGYRHDGRLFSRLLAQFVNNNAALTYLPLLSFFPPPTINGMAYAMRTERLAALGGFAPLVGHLTDDLALARQVTAGGGTIHQGARPQWVQTTVRGGAHYVQLMHRWFLFALLLLRGQTPVLAGVISLVHGLPPVLLLGLVVAAVAEPGLPSVACLLVVLAVRALFLVTLQRRLYGRSSHEPLFSVASELLQPLHLAHAALWRRIVWRKRRYRVRDETHFQALL